VLGIKSCARIGRRLFAAVFFLFPACSLFQPEVVVVNNTAPEIMIRNPCFNGIIWNTVLKYGEATSPRRCLRGEGRVHFQKFDAYRYCRNQARYEMIDSLCMCDSSWNSNDTDLISATPLWFNYQTQSVENAQMGGFHKIELSLDNMEQDFSVPGPYGH
jgi:hypothetical protein